MSSVVPVSGCYLRGPDLAGHVGGSDSAKKWQQALAPDTATTLTAAQLALLAEGKPVPAPTDCDPSDADGDPSDDNCTPPAK